jgi:hypothetical protein
MIQTRQQLWENVVSDLVKQLRECQDWAANPCLWGEAADRIEQLEAALLQIKAVCDDNLSASCNHLMAVKFVRNVAAEALQGEK